MWPTVSSSEFLTGKPRTGYKAEPDPDLAPRIRQAIDARFKGATLDEMKEIIGGVFADKAREMVRLLMLKPLLFGQMTFGGTTMDNYCEPIIDKETFDNLQLYNKTAPKEYQNLNDSAQQFVGRTVTIAEDVVDSQTKVKVGDTYWLAYTEKPLKKGDKAKVTAVKDSLILIVE